MGNRKGVGWKGLYLWGGIASFLLVAVSVQLAVILQSRTSKIKVRMTFEQAQQKIEDRLHLIGRKIKGGIIDEFIIFPSEETSKEIFKDLYFITSNATESIEPFKNMDVSVCAVINKKALSQKFFLTASLEEIEDELSK